MGAPAPGAAPEHDAAVGRPLAAVPGLDTGAAWFIPAIRANAMATRLERLKSIVRQLPILGPLSVRAYAKLQSSRFESSRSYWASRYRNGGNSGAGSYGRLAEFKAEVINGYVAENGISSVIEFGCGDGNQLRMADYPRYIGIDISADAVEHCRKQWAHDATKTFATLDDYRGEAAELSLSLDVVYHLVEDSVFDAYMTRLFEAGSRAVIVYSSNTDRQQAAQPPHVRHREFTRWVDANASAYRLAKHIPNRYPGPGLDGQTSFAEFFVFERG